MKPRLITGKSKSVAALLLGLLLVSGMALAQDQNPAAQSSPVADPETAQKLAQAEGLHDLAVLYIRTRDVDRALGAARQIIRLRLPPEFQKAVAQSLSIITEKLAENRRFDLGQVLLDEALRTPELEPIYSRLHRNKARVCMMAGENDCAIRHWRKALEIEGRPER